MYIKLHQMHILKGEYSLFRGCTFKVHKLHQNYNLEGEYSVLRGYVRLEEFMYLVFTCMPGENYRRRFRSVLLCLCLNIGDVCGLKNKTKTVSDC